MVPPKGPGGEEKPNTPVRRALWWGGWGCLGAIVLLFVVVVVGLAWEEYFGCPPRPTVFSLEELESYLPLALPASCKMLDAYTYDTDFSDGWTEYQMRLQIAAADMPAFVSQPKLPGKFWPKRDDEALFLPWQLRRAWPELRRAKPADCRSWSGDIPLGADDHHHYWSVAIVVAKVTPDTAMVYICMSGE